MGLALSFFSTSFVGFRLRKMVGEKVDMVLYNIPGSRWEGFWEGPAVGLAMVSRLWKLHRHSVSSS